LKSSKGKRESPDLLRLENLKRLRIQLDPSADTARITETYRDIRKERGVRGMVQSNGFSKIPNWRIEHEMIPK